MSSVLSSAYSGAASIGEAKATLSVVVGAVVVLGLIVSASFSIMSKPSRTNKVEAEVIDSICTQVTTKGDGKTYTHPDCVSTVKYVVNDNIYTANVNTGTEKLIEGAKTTIKYNPSNPIDISYNEPSMNMIGWILSGVALCIALGIGIYYYAVTRFKPLAAYEGASTSINLAKGLANKIF